MPEIKFKFAIERVLTTEEKSAVEIIDTLKKAGFEAFWAGGAVRDLLLNKELHDIDIATAARPQDIKKLFPDSYDRGKTFGVVAIRFRESEFEVTTFRQDVGIADHRHPVKIEFATAEGDAKRRDFTVNGIFYNPIEKEIIDYVDGLTDIKRGIIQFIGKPQDRIKEDYLRLIRAVRFACRLNFKIEPESKKAIKENANKISEVSSERIRDELSKMLLNEHRAEALKMLSELGLLKAILPEVEDLINVAQPQEFHHEGDCFIHTLLALENIGNLLKLPRNFSQEKNIGETKSEELVWCVLLHDIAKPETKGFRSQIGKTSITFFDHDVRSAEKAVEILTRFKFSHHFIESVNWAISQHMRIINAFRGMGERKQKKLFCDPNIELLLSLTKADLSASLRPNNLPDMAMYEDALKLRAKFEKEMSEEEKHQMKKFDLITGTEIMKLLKLPAGPKIGEIKNEIEKAYLEGKINSKNEALEIVMSFK